MNVKLSDLNTFQKITKICFQISDSFSLESYNKYSLTKKLFKTKHCVIYRPGPKTSFSGRL